MKIWILRLNGRILAEYSRMKVQDAEPEHQEKKDESWISSLFSNLIATAPEEKAKERGEEIVHNRRCLVTELVDHSRKLSRHQYQKQLNYTRLRGKEYYYLARYRLLFVYEQDNDDVSIKGIENILDKTVRLYQGACLGICKEYKLPINLSDYQRGELQRLSDKINDIIEQEDDFQFVRKQSIRESWGPTAANVINQREKSLKLILQRQNSEERRYINLEHESAKKANKYRLKLCLLCFLLVLVSVVTLYLLLTDSYSLK